MIAHHMDVLLTPWVITDTCPARMGAVLTQGVNWQSACPAAFMLKKFTSMQHTYFAYELEALGVLEALMKWLDELMGGHTFTVVTDHKALTYFKEKNHTAGHHIRWQNFFYGFNCKIIYIEGHKNKVADALSHYYSSSSDKDLHYNDFILADIRIDKLGEDLPLSQAEEAWEMLFLNKLQLEEVRIATGSLQNKRDLQADQLNPPNDCIVRVCPRLGVY